MFENTNNKTDIETDIGKNGSTEPRKTQAKKHPKTRCFIYRYSPCHNKLI